MKYGPGGRSFDDGTALLPPYAAAKPSQEFFQIEGMDRAWLGPRCVPLYVT
jgi:hypothetical protein